MDDGLKEPEFPFFFSNTRSQARLVKAFYEQLLKLRR